MPTVVSHAQSVVVFLACGRFPVRGGGWNPPYQTVGDVFSPFGSRPSEKIRKNPKTFFQVGAGRALSGAKGDSRTRPGRAFDNYRKACSALRDGRSCRLIVISFQLWIKRDLYDDAKRQAMGQIVIGDSKRARWREEASEIVMKGGIEKGISIQRRRISYQLSAVSHK